VYSFGPPDSDPDPFRHQTKIVRKTLRSTVFDFFMTFQKVISKKTFGGWKFLLITCRLKALHSPRIKNIEFTYGIFGHQKPRSGTGSRSTKKH
jgi:hypothetical protein